jgi:hypothetical protein
LIYYLLKIHGEVEMERWQLSTKEVAKYSVIENAIKGYLKASQAVEQLHLSTRRRYLG